jgi:hypothetical protein
MTAFTVELIWGEGRIYAIKMKKVLAVGSERNAGGVGGYDGGGGTAKRKG